MTASDAAAQNGRLPGGPGFGALVHETRRLLDAVAASDPPDHMVEEVTRLIRAATTMLDHGIVDEATQPGGRRPDLPGRGNPLLVPLVVIRELPDETLGTVTFSRAHLGGGSAVHGGMLPLLFDDVLGHLAARGRAPSRTAYLHVEYRHVTPLDRPLRVHARIDRIEGRKIFTAGTVRDGDTVTAEATGLFVIVRPELQAALAAGRV